MPEPSKDAVTLRALTVHPGRLSPPFYPPFRKYVLFAPHDAQRVQVTADGGDGRVVIGGREAQGVGMATVDVPAGLTQVPIEVASADGLTRREILLTIKRPLPTPTWRCLAAGNPFLPRDSAGELVFQDHMWLFGGYTPEVIDDVWRSRDGVNWEPMPPITGSGGINVPIRFVFNDQMWLTTHGGRYMRSRDGKAWERIDQPMPWAGRITAGSAVFKGRVWILGGRRGDHRLNDVWSSADGLTWRLETAAAPWTPRQLHDNVVVHQDMLWVIGGGIQNYHPWKVYRDVWRSPDGIHWEQVLDEAPWSGRNWASCAVYRGRMWLLGGFQSEPTWNNFNDVWYSEDGAQWRQLVTPEIWTPRHEVSPYVFADKLWVVAGNAWPLMKDTWQLALAGLAFISQPPIEDYVGARYRYQAQADFGVSGAAIRYRLLEHPPWLHINTDTGLIRGTIPDDQPATVAVEARDGSGATATQRYTLYPQTGA